MPSASAPALKPSRLRAVMIGNGKALRGVVLDQASRDA